MDVGWMLVGALRRMLPPWKAFGTVFGSATPPRPLPREPDLGPPKEGFWRFGDLETGQHGDLQDPRTAGSEIGALGELGGSIPARLRPGDWRIAGWRLQTWSLETGGLETGGCKT